jgi:hypothetical protein
MIVKEGGYATELFKIRTDELTHPHKGQNWRENGCFSAIQASSQSRNPAPEGCKGLYF